MLRWNDPVPLVQTATAPYLLGVLFNMCPSAYIIIMICITLVAYKCALRTAVIALIWEKSVYPWILTETSTYFVGGGPKGHEWIFPSPRKKGSMMCLLCTQSPPKHFLKEGTHKEKGVVPPPKKIACKENRNILNVKSLSINSIPFWLSPKSSPCFKFQNGLLL